MSEQFHIVGIGASAGGVQALQQFFEHMPVDTGMGFVVVLHQSPDHPTELPDILARHTKLPVVLAEEGLAVKPATAYVVPGDKAATLEKGRLRLHALEPRTRRRPIDVFFSSLAVDLNELAVGIILSGSGSDGTLGVKAIKEHGGFTLAQDVTGDGPQHRNMPDTAIAVGVIDVVLPIEELGARLLQFVQSNYQITQATEADTQDPATAAASLYNSIYKLLLQQIGHDFSGYKQKTFIRRVQRRMHVLQKARLEEYVQHLTESPEEVTALFRDLLIGVTNFFRDSDAFEALATQIIPKVFENKRSADTVRIWCPGCATGEEVYSIAILVREHLDTLATPPKVQIFATDIDERALEVARTGRYPAALVEHIEPRRLKRFFLGDEMSCTVTKEVRDMCIFSSHSIIRDPPFSRMDLISCRNLLIYLGADFQSRVIPVFHFALRPGGYLFLGTSENVSQHVDLFSPVDKRLRIFQRRDNVHVPLQFPMPSSIARVSTPDLRRNGEIAVNLRRTAEARIMDRFAPAHVVVNVDGDVLHYSSRTGKYLEPAAGLPNRQLLAMTRRGLRLDLRAALREAVESRRPVTRYRVSVEIEERIQLVNITVEPFGENERDLLFLVVFTDVGLPFERTDELDESAERDESHERLEQELRDTRERLQGTIEEYETAVEELKSSNEELQSINEELQSTNEELETSKEELQSLNEELHTVNLELNSKLEEIDRANSDLQNLFESTQIATVFLDRSGVIRSFTPAVTDIFKLIQSDRGRPLSDIASHVELGDLWGEVAAVLERGESVQRNVRRLDGSGHYFMRILPYHARHYAVEGVVVTFIDVTKMIEAEVQQRTMVEELNHRVRNMLTIVNAIASQTMSRATSMESFKAAFTGRIRAMGLAYNLVSQECWGDVSLEEVVARQLQPYASGRVQISGPRVLFKPSAALAFGMVIHEMSTNAVKYGALANAQGRIDIRWTAEIGAESILRFEWQESSSASMQDRTHKGFGTELIERELKYVLHATTQFRFEPRGLHVSMLIPVEPELLKITSGEPA